MTPRPEPSRRSVARGAALVAAGALLAIGLGAILLLIGPRLDGRRLIDAATGGEALAEACRGSLVRGLTEKGFQPSEVEFGPAPTVGPFWERDRRFGDSFTFQDGAEQVRVDGVMACVMSKAGVAVEFRVASNPHRDA